MYRLNSVGVCPCFKKYLNYLNYAKIFGITNCITQCGVLIRSVFPLQHSDAVRVRPMLNQKPNHFRIFSVYDCICQH